jgi:hypothetical protein
LARDALPRCDRVPDGGQIDATGKRQGKRCVVAWVDVDQQRPLFALDEVELGQSAEADAREQVRGCLNDVTIRRDADSEAAAAGC